MASSAVNLTQLAAETSAALDSIWDAIGVSGADRQSFLAALSDHVASLYKSAVTEQETRREELQSEIQTLYDTIINMQHAMEEKEEAPEQNGRTMLTYRDALESVRATLQELWDEREQNLKDLEGTLFKLYDDIDEDIQSDYTSIGTRMTLARITAYQTEITRVSTVKQERTEEINRICDEIAEIWNEMELSAAEGDDIEAHIQEGREALGFGQAIIQTLSTKLNALQTEKAVREERISDMGKQITALWKRLATSEQEQTEFLENYAGLGEGTLQAVEAYLAEKQAEFQTRLVDLIADARKQIEAMWDIMRAGPAQRAEMFAPFSEDGPFTDELFQIHESYISQLSAALEDLKPILKGIEKREELRADKAEYESIIADPSRLLGRVNSVARLKEERLERRVKRELPAVTKKLREQVVEWEKRSGRDFCVDDLRYLDSLDAEDAAESKAKEDAKAARDAARTAAVTAAANESNAKPRSTSAGRMSVYRPPTSVAVAALSSTGPSKKTGAALSRKPSVSSGEGEKPAEENAPASTGSGSAPVAAAVNAKRTTTVPTISAPSVPLKDTNKPASARGVAPTAGKDIVVSEASKASAAKILAQL